MARSIHSHAIRVTHWTNAAATAVMIGSGWQIYNTSPILPFVYPNWMTLGGWLGGALLWHFAAMWVLALNGICYLAYGLIGGRLQRRLQPLSFDMLLADMRRALHGQLAHDDLAQYNAVQKFSYLGVLSLLMIAITSGIAVWKPVQFHWLSELFGGF